MKNRIIPFFLIVTIGILMGICAWFDSTVYNENGRLASGLNYWRTGNYSAFRVNPPLTSLVGAFPSLLTGAKHVTRAELGFSSFGRDEYYAGSLFVEKNPHYRLLLFSGRLCCIALILISFAVSFRFAKSLYGIAAGYFLIGLFLCSPYILGHGHLIGPDAAAGGGALFAVYFFWRWLRVPENANAVIAGAALGLAELTKFTLILFYPLFPLLWILYRFPKSAGKDNKQASLTRQFFQLLLIIAVSLFMINMGYMFEGTGKQLRTFKFKTILLTGCKTVQEIPSGGGNRFDGSGNIMETALGYLPMPLPKNFIQGIDTQRVDFENGMLSYMRGKWSEKGWYSFYLYALLLKTPIGTLSLFLLAFFCTFFLKGYNCDWRDELVVLLPGLALLAFVSSQNGFSSHSRYVIPALPFFLLWSCKTARAFLPEQKSAYPKTSQAVRWIAVLLLLWSVGSSLWVYPHSIAYFNELSAIIPTPEDQNYPRCENPSQTGWQKFRRLLDAGPLNGPRHLLHSNADWEQDLYYLDRWCKKHPEVDALVMRIPHYCPTETLSVPAASPKETEKGTKLWYAVSVSYIYDRSQNLRYFLNFVPEAVIGYTTYIYHISQEEIDRVKSRSQETE